MTNPNRHILGNFDEALDGLRNDVLMMASIAERSLGHAVAGLFERNSDRCNIAIADDEELDQLEIQVDKDGIEVLIRFQPVASDLRRVICAMKASNALERVGDQAVSIARRARRLNQSAALPEVALVQPLWELARRMLDDAVDAYIRGDAAQARSLKLSEEDLDRQSGEVGRKLTERMVEHPSKIENYLALLFISRHFERVGDQAESIAEDVVYAVEAQDIRHSPSAQGATGS